MSNEHALAPMQRCPNCHTRFQAVDDVDAHLASLSQQPAPEVVELLRECRSWILAENANETWDAEKALVARIDAAIQQADGGKAIRSLSIEEGGA